MSVLKYASERKPKSRTEAGWREWLWAPYLGISWTWCIGMFLPILLVRDFGWLAYILFAVPNVVGAAAMGFTIATPDSSRLLVESHKFTARVFSIITIAFHFYFAAWIIRIFWGPPAFWILLAGGVAAFVLVSTHRVVSRILCVIAFMVSLTLLTAVGGTNTGQVVPTLVGNGWIPGLGLVCLFGFALCPYLDLTFHRARQQHTLNADGRVVFSVGFGVFFFTMILATLAYAVPMEFTLRDGLYAGDQQVIPLVAAHLLLQASITVGLHVQELLQPPVFDNASDLSRRHWVAGLIVAVAVAALVGSAMNPLTSYHGLTIGELFYRCFMGFYGLVFPAYVWLCMIPGRGKLKPTRRQIVITCIAVFVALPMFWMGFIERHMGWLVPGVGVVLLARLFDRRSNAEAVLFSASTGSTQQNSAPISN